MEQASELTLLKKLVVLVDGQLVLKAVRTAERHYFQVWFFLHDNDFLATGDTLEQAARTALEAAVREKKTFRARRLLASGIYHGAQRKRGE